jgi:hypothetical protein
MKTELILSPPTELQPASLFMPTPKAAKARVGILHAQINNDHTRKAYLNATLRFAAWCEGRGLQNLSSVQHS